MSKIAPSDELVVEMQKWRRDIHAHPETAFEEIRTSDFIKAKLESFGIDVHQGLAKTGVVGTLKNGDGPAIGLRADMDALHLMEKTNLEHSSTIDGKMHACGHDGHMAMLLGAAKYLSEDQSFAGTVHFIFQPAEENAGGGRVMVEEGLFDLFPVENVFGLHNWPELPAGTMAMKAGPLMAAVDSVEIKIKGKGCHGAMPHLGVDPIVVASEVVLALQTISSRILNPQDAVVISITQIHAWDARNIIPDEVVMGGTIRSFTKEVQLRLESDMRRIIKGICEAHGATFELTYTIGYPATVNDVLETQMAAQAAIRVVGKENVNLNPVPSMAAEDFSYLLQAKPGCYVWLGTGGLQGGCLLHNPHFDFNDDVLHLGASYWVELVEQVLPID
jgi:amidohydrolase